MWISWGAGSAPLINSEACRNPALRAFFLFFGRKVTESVDSILRSSPATASVSTPSHPSLLCRPSCCCQHEAKLRYEADGCFWESDISWTVCSLFYMLYVKKLHVLICIEFILESVADRTVCYHLLWMLQQQKMKKSRCTNPDVSETFSEQKSRKLTCVAINIMTTLFPLSVTVRRWEGVHKNLLLR